MISKSLVALIEDEMLVPHGEGRLDSKLLSVRFEQLLARRQRDSAASAVLIHGSERRHTRTQTSPGAVPGVRDAHEGPEHAHRHDQTRISQQSFKTIQSFVQDTNYQIDQMITETSEASQETMSELRSDLSRESISHNRRADTKVDHEDSKAQKEPRTTRIPMLTTNDVDLWRANKRLGTSPPPAPPGLEEIIEQLQGRDQLFVIDDAESMKRHLPSLKSVAEAMISLAKKADPDGVELIFTSKPKEVKRKSFFTFKSETDDLVKQIIARFGKDKLPGSTSMENKLGVILDRIDWTGSRTSVYVLTDGVWMDSGDPGGGVENPIKSLVSRLKRRHRMRDAVTIQFIQFGDDQRGSDRLAWLDDELPKSGPEYRDFDIVDTRKHDESLYLLMIGALRHYIDEVETGKVG
ncbi:hypothetical protein BJ166DRAFT_14123 [Pestalotiopsis sp. NC0098]|nr:hypothetical protein BJ166DRAFT_14123 [Pestalotiopsis sp. NC0098]